VNVSKSVEQLIEAIDLERARAATEAATVRTATIASPELSELVGAAVALKCECLQRTGSFKLRGVLSKVASLGGRARAGLVTASAGNHGRAVAYACQLRDIPCEVYIPRDAPVSKVEAVERLGARVNLSGGSVEEALALARERSMSDRGDGPTLVHPFDDLDVIAGQATVALELLEDVGDLARVVVPVGGGGLASGVGAALRSAGANVELVGVQARACAPYAGVLGGLGEPLELPLSTAATIADGIALKRRGELTLPLLRDMLDELVTVTEDEIADAMVFLAERSKLVAEGAGAVAVAALLSGRLRPLAGCTVAVVSGGNVDGGLLAAVLRRSETEEGRRVRLFTRVEDRPGALAELLSLIGGARANLLTLEHVREAIPLHVRETGLELTLETRGPAHTRELLGTLEREGYEVSVE
jgi:threonine dehydratase